MLNHTVKVDIIIAFESLWLLFASIFWCVFKSPLSVSPPVIFKFSLKHIISSMWGFDGFFPWMAFVRPSHLIFVLCHFVTCLKYFMHVCVFWRLPVSRLPHHSASSLCFLSNRDYLSFSRGCFFYRPPSFWQIQSILQSRALICLVLAEIAFLARHSEGLLWQIWQADWAAECFPGYLLVIWLGDWLTSEWLNDWLVFRQRDTLTGELTRCKVSVRHVSPTDSTCYFTGRLVGNLLLVTWWLMLQRFELTGGYVWAALLCDSSTGTWLEVHGTVRQKRILLATWGQ